MEKVSIIIPVYNMEKYLVQCLESVVNQTYSNIEVIIVDDGSIDGSSDICDTYAARYDYVKCFHKANGGLCSARNFGLHNASGDWILFVDSDDWCSKDYIYKLMGESGCRNNVDVVLSSVYIQKKDGTFRFANDTYLEDGIYDNADEMKMLHALSIGNMRNWKKKWSDRLDPTGANAAPWNKLYKREILEKRNVKFEEETSVMEDMLFNMRYFSYVKCAAYADTKGYFYRYVPSGITKGFDNKRLEKERYFFEQVEEFCNQNTDNPYFEDAKKMRTIISLQMLLRWVARAGHYMKISQIRAEVHQYLQQPVLYKSIHSTKMNELSNLYSKTTLFLAKHEMILLMYIIGNIMLVLR